VARPIVMPSFGMYTAEGTLVSWRKPSGAAVEGGEVVLEIETEKAVQEVGAPVDGVLHHVLAEGAQLQVETLIGYVLAPGETPPADGNGSTAPSVAAAAGVAAPAARDSALVKPAARDSALVKPAARDSALVKEDVRASPIARRLAREHGVDLSTLAGTGPGGRIVESDVRAVADARGRSSAPSAIPVARRAPLSVMRRGIGERLRRTVDTAVSLTLTREVRVEALVAARAVLGKATGHSIPYDAFIVKALAAALERFPDLNATIEGADLVVFSEINIGFAVAVEGGLVVPVVRGANALTVTQVAAAIRDVSAKASAGTLAPGDTAGGTATVTNLGAYGIDAFTPVLNPPQALVLGVGRIQQRPVVEDGALVVGTTSVLSLTFDHRVTDGAPAARLLDAIASALSDARQLEAWQ
jgi:pyruvate dehydrogenase E2 component (dihydrolipoamide acetyltransferase)